jgi:hypothetical protein
MRINKFIKNNFKYGIINLTAGKNDYHFRYDSSKKLWNCYIYDSKELEIARFFDRYLEPIQEIIYKNDSEVLEAIKSL